MFLPVSQRISLGGQGDAADLQGGGVGQGGVGGGCEGAVQRHQEGERSPGRRLGLGWGALYSQTEGDCQVKLLLSMTLQGSTFNFREELGDDLEIVVLEMSLEEQMERVRGRGGSQHKVDCMKVKLFSNLFPL